MAVLQLEPLPRPEFLIGLISGETKIEAPILPKRDETEVIVTKIQRLTPEGIVYSDAYSTKQYKTAESKRWRAQQLEIFNARKDVFPAYCLDCLIDELQTRAGDVDVVFNHDGSLQRDLDALVEMAFTSYGVEEDDREQKIPWTNETRGRIVAQLRELSIRYGKPRPDQREPAQNNRRADREPGSGLKLPVSRPERAGQHRQRCDDTEAHSRVKRPEAADFEAEQHPQRSGRRRRPV